MDTQIDKPVTVNLVLMKKVVDGKGNATRVGRKNDEKTGKSVRYSKKSGEVIK